MLKLFFDESEQYKELGIDEAGRGCLAGRVYVAGVILNKTQENDELFKVYYIHRKNMSYIFRLYK